MPTQVGPWTIPLPATTPTGRPVTIQRDARADSTLMHAESPDQSELYFEVLCYRTLRDHAGLVAAQQTFLREHADDHRIGAAASITVNGLPATTFDFEGLLQGRWKVRRFLFIDAGGCTHRIVFDPTSALNHELLGAVEFSGV